ncbi:hypothetical protein IHE61_31015 [Streptomyces sp. GKU 257-1]|nr:hypothetical protein [Streptomyces sp. GKU 257-1]
MSIGMRFAFTYDENDYGEITETYIRYIDGMPVRFTRAEFCNGQVLVSVETPSLLDLLARDCTPLTPEFVNWTPRRQINVSALQD